MRAFCRCLILVAGLAVLSTARFAGAQEKPKESPPPSQSELTLHKSVDSREFQGRQYEGEERQIGRGDSLWRILVEEKGVPGHKFHSYLVLIRGLNPQVKNLDVLRIGDKIFVPLRLDDLSEGQRRSESVKQPDVGKRGTTVEYRVKPGEHLYQILRDQLKISDERKLAQYYALVRDLNPERKDWDTLVGGEVIRLPAEGSAAPSQTAATASKTSPQSAPETVAVAQPPTKEEQKTSSPAFDPRKTLTSPAKENLPLLAKVVEAMGIEMRRSGEEVVKLGDSTVRFERQTYPVAYDATSKQKLVIDPEGKIPASLKAKLTDPSVGTPVLPIVNGVTIQEAVGRLFAGLGYQSLPANQPIIIQEEGVSFEAKGDWMVLAPEVSNKMQQMYLVNITDHPNEIPEYLKSELAKKGLHLRDIAIGRDAPSEPGVAEKNQIGPGRTEIKNWPRDKQGIVDALLLSYGINFGVGESLSVEVGDGLRVDTAADRYFEWGGKRTALFFTDRSPEVRKSLEQKNGITPVVLNLASMSSREIIARLLNVLGDPAVYQEHRFPAAAGSSGDRLAVHAWGFQPARQPLFVTDRQIPPVLERFFFEKGLEIVYFQ